MPIIVVTGTGTDVGKTVVTAAAATTCLAQGHTVAVLKPAQTGTAPDQPGDISEIQRLAGPITGIELTRYPDPLSPATAARLAGLPTLTPQHIAEAARELETTHDLVLIEGAGGLLVRYNEEGATLADVARLLDAPLLLVTTPALGTLNATELTVREAGRRGLDLLGLVIGAWPAHPDLAARCNLTDLPAVTRVNHRCECTSFAALHWRSAAPARYSESLP